MFKRILALFFVLLFSQGSFSHEDEIPVPVSINALMVTLIDHSAHYLWDYGHTSTLRGLTEHEWQIVEYYAIQLAASGPLITLGGSGSMDNGWAKSPDWIRYSKEMTDISMNALLAARSRDKAALQKAADILVESCVGCHDVFKPDVPTEGIMHDPEYDHLHHLLSPHE